MIEAFLSDKSAFRLKIFAYLFVDLLLLFGMFYLGGSAVDMFNDNNKLERQYEEERIWLSKFNVVKAQNLVDSVLKPVSEKEIEMVHNRQLKILSDNSVAVVTAQKDRLIDMRNKGKKYPGGLSTVKVTLAMKSSWRNLVKALNMFEKENLVVITDLQLTSGNGRIVSTRMTYEIFYKEGNQG